MASLSFKEQRRRMAEALQGVSANCCLPAMPERTAPARVQRRAAGFGEVKKPSLYFLK